MHRWLLLLQPILLLAAPAAAQAQIEIVPQVGLYLPTNDFIVRTRNEFAIDPTPAKQGKGLALGGVVRGWVTPTLGIQVGGSRLRSDLRIDPDHSPVSGSVESATLTVLSLSGLIRLPGTDTTNAAWFEFGAVRIARGGDAYRGYRHTSNVGGVLGLGTGLVLSPRVQLDLGFRAMLYNLGLQDRTGYLPNRVQGDLLAFAGVGLRVR